MWTTVTSDVKQLADYTIHRVYADLTAGTFRQESVACEDAEDFLGGIARAFKLLTIMIYRSLWRTLKWDLRSCLLQPAKKESLLNLRANPRRLTLLLSERLRDMSLKDAIQGRPHLNTESQWDM